MILSVISPEFSMTSDGAIMVIITYRNSYLWGIDWNHLKSVPEYGKLLCQAATARVLSVSLFVPENDNRIDSGRAACGKVTCAKDHSVQHHHYCYIGSRITSTNPEEQVRKQVRKS